VVRQNLAKRDSILSCELADLCDDLLRTLIENKIFPRSVGRQFLKAGFGSVNIRGGFEPDEATVPLSSQDVERICRHISFPLLEIDFDDWKKHFSAPLEHCRAMKRRIIDLQDRLNAFSSAGRGNALVQDPVILGGGTCSFYNLNEAAFDARSPGRPELAELRQSVGSRAVNGIYNGAVSCVDQPTGVSDLETRRLYGTNGVLRFDPSF
jgi:hypothetical protein